MTKRELILDVSSRLNGHTQSDVANVIQATFETIVEQLVDGNRLEVRNFGVFDIKVRDARIGRNPKTGDSVSVAKKCIPIFKPGKALRNMVEMSNSFPKTGR